MYCQDGILLIPVMLAHCITDGIQIHWDVEYKAYLPKHEMTIHLYRWMELYCDKIKSDMLSVGLWDCLCCYAHLAHHCCICRSCTCCQT